MEETNDNIDLNTKPLNIETLVCGDIRLESSVFNAHQLALIVEAMLDKKTNISKYLEVYKQKKQNGGVGYAG